MELELLTPVPGPGSNSLDHSCVHAVPAAVLTPPGRLTEPGMSRQGFQGPDLEGLLLKQRQVPGG